MVPVNVLLIEDDPHDVELTKLALERAPVQNHLRVASNGASALAYLRDVGLSGFDLIVLDLKMPVLDGLGMLEELGAEVDLGDATVAVLTSSSRDEDRQRALELGADTYIVKDPDFEAFRADIEALLGAVTEG